MKFNRWWWWCTFSFGLCLCVDEDVHYNFPRWFRIFSKGPEEEDVKYEGKNVINHVDNALKGGTIGVEVDMKKHVGKLGKLWGKVQKYLSKIRKFKARSSPPLAEDRELEGFSPEGIDPRKKKWPPSRLEASDRMSDRLHLESRDKLDPDSLRLDSRDKLDPDSLRLDSRDELDPDIEILSFHPRLDNNAISSPRSRPYDIIDPDSEMLDVKKSPAFLPD